jgi:hypothetical protein
MQQWCETHIHGKVKAFCDIKDISQNDVLYYEYEIIMLTCKKDGM